MSSHERTLDVDGTTAEDLEDAFADVSPAAVMALDDELTEASDHDDEVGALLADGLGDD